MRRPRAGCRCDEQWVIFARCGKGRDGLDRQHRRRLAADQALIALLGTKHGHAFSQHAGFGCESLVLCKIGVDLGDLTGGNATTWELQPEVWRRVVEVNLVAPYLACRAVVPQMLQRGYGRIVNVASVAGKEGNPNASHYSAAKAGLIALTKSLAKELATQGVLVNAVSPAAAKTAIFDQMSEQHIAFMLSKIPMGRFVQVGEIAALIAWLASEDCSFSTGAVFDISGGRATY